MKTPREILLQRHAGTGPKLDAIRRAAIQELNNQETKAQSIPARLVSWFLCGSETLWRELIWPCRRTWAGLATIWVALAVFNAVHTERAPTVVAKSNPRSPEMRLAFREQRQLLDEIIGPAAPMSPAETPRRPNNKPRSDRRREILTA